MRIERVEVRVVAPKVQRFTWSHDLPEQHMTNTIVRVTTADGIEGVGGVSSPTAGSRTVRSRCPKEEPPAHPSRHPV